MSAISTPTEIVYPDSDGRPMAENTLQYEWIVTIKGNLDRICVGERAAFVAGDNLIYPVEGRPDICKAPDVYVAFGRPRGHRGSYKVWEEDGVFPHVVFEITSPGNTAGQLMARRQFYQRYGAGEYYVYDPLENLLEIYARDGRHFVPIDDVQVWTSPRLGIRFETHGDRLVILQPDGRPFLTFDEICEENDAVRLQSRRAEARAVEADERAQVAEAAARLAVETARLADERANRAAADATAAHEQAARLRAKLRAAGIDPDAA